MRFFEKGPSIPSHLLEQRSLGNVIVFCGAGISRRAGLPDFGGLTQKIINSLGAEKAKRALGRGESFDRVFNALISEFGGTEIDRQIHDALKTPRRPDLRNHEIVLDLSRNSSGIPQIVTTNFDLLFERVQRDLPRFVPPSLPDLGLGVPLQGLVYLHGRLAKPQANARAGYIISSADFGRAYLAEGWAARFIRELRERHTILLLGYSADDPPMRYLLEGLHGRADAAYNDPIYAFASDAERQEEWRDRGVTPIAYDPIDQDQSGLWDTLSAWASAAVDPDTWDRHRTALAAKRPSELKAFERGQIANLISTKAGAGLFADAQPTPPAQWLCVFDANARYAKPRKESFDSEVETDPLDLFGLDDDPPRPGPEQNGQVTIPGTSLIGWLFGDTSYPERMRLGGWSPEWSNPLPARLNHLARWFGKVAGEPAAVWWAAGYFSLHPGLVSFVDRRLRDSNDLCSDARNFWQLYLESSSIPLLGEHDFRWFEFQEVVKRNGWSSFTLRELERALQPRVAIGRSPFGPPSPPISDWHEIGLTRFLELKVRVPERHDTEIPIPDDRLLFVVEAVRRSLVRTAQLMDEIGTDWWPSPSLHPIAGNATFYGDDERFFLWFVSLFQRLTSIDPISAKSEVAHWDCDDPTFFGKLCIFSQMDPVLASGKEACLMLLKLPDEVFFGPHNRRELLFTLRARWTHFTERERRKLEVRIIKGPPRREGVRLTDYRQGKAATAASELRWLEMNGCNLTSSTERQLPILKAANRDWSDDWARSIDDSFAMRSGWVETVKDAQGLGELAIDKVIAEAEKGSEDRIAEFRHYRPFDGLVESAPFRALSALRREGKRSRYPVSFWRALLSNWPAGTTVRLRWLLAASLAALPKAILHELRHYAPAWLKEHLKALAELDRTLALRIYDAVFEAYAGAPEEVTESAVGTTTIGGVVQERSEVSFGKAINSPIGKLTECLFSFIGEPIRFDPFPCDVADRLGAAFEVPSNGGGHAVAIAAQRMGWLDHFYPQWVRQTLVPLLALSNPLAEAAWHGRAHDQNGLSNATWKLLVGDFLSVIAGKANWRLDEHELRTFVRGLAWLCKRSGRQPPIISSLQAAAVLRALDDRRRADVLFALADMMSNNGEWQKFVKPFINEAWPRPLRYRGEQASRAFANLAAISGADFPDVVKTILPFVRPVSHLDMITYRLSKVDPTDEVDPLLRFPEAVLELLDALVAEDRASTPYGLAGTLDMIADAQPSMRQSAPWRRLHDLTI